MTLLTSPQQGSSLAVFSNLQEELHSLQYMTCPAHNV